MKSVQEGPLVRQWRRPCNDLLGRARERARKGGRASALAPLAGATEDAVANPVALAVTEEDRDLLRSTALAAVTAALDKLKETKNQGALAKAADQAVAAAMARAAEGIPYLLQVVTRIRRDHVREITKKGSKLVGLIEEEGLTLVHASASLPQEGTKPQDNVEIDLHINWDMGHDANALLAAERDLPDKPEYAKFESFIIKETKEIIMPLARVSRDGPRDKDESYVYMLVKCNVKTKKLAEFQARLEESLVPFAKERKWFFGDAYLGVTGKAGNVSQLWLIPESMASDAKVEVTKAPWHALINGQAVTQILTPLESIDPHT